MAAGRSVQPAAGASPALLFALCTAIWGSTWLGITFQLGTVAPEVSVVWRFLLAAAILAAYCLATGRSLRFRARSHLRFAAQGALMFGLNYAAVYWAERDLASGLVAVLFSTLTLMSPLGMRIAFGTPVTLRVLAGAGLGVTGVALLFLPELRAAGDSEHALRGIAWALIATFLAMLGNLVSVQMHRERLPVLPSTAWGMFYGVLLTAGVVVVTGAQWSFDPRAPYVLSLLYLAIFGSVVAFIAYLTLLQQVGAGPASYTAVSTPVIAMLLSTAFEGYRWTGVAALGVALAVAGNVLAVRGKRR
jgi:drug/metabolite transporter (DMT)-like permease